jgi:hypothetical protein
MDCEAERAGFDEAGSNTPTGGVGTEGKEIEMAKTIRRIGLWWSMKADRELIALSKTKTLAALVDYFKRPPTAILDKAKRLGLSIKRGQRWTAFR